eukprot:COSAG02_NODE_3180_length_7217_cov_2.502810_3_plen_146_part_00
MVVPLHTKPVLCLLIRDRYCCASFWAVASSVELNAWLLEPSVPCAFCSVQRACVDGLAANTVLWFWGGGLGIGCSDLTPLRAEKCQGESTGKRSAPWWSSSPPPTTTTTTISNWKTCSWLGVELTVEQVEPGCVGWRVPCWRSRC